MSPTKTVAAAIATNRLSPLLSKAVRSTSQIWADLTNMASLTLSPSTTFNAKKHLAFTPPSKIYTMTDLKLADSPISSFAVSEPFQLFSASAVDRFRAEIFKPAVMTKYKYTSNLAPAQLRGYAKKEAPFIYQAWKNPEVLAIISAIAGVDLVPCTDFEIAHINLSSTAPADKPDPTAAICNNDTPIVDWHTDSYPFVCVTMLSDCSGMIGGETAVRTGDGQVLKVRGPGKGCAVILQGRYIPHKALRAFGGSERITSVTSFRPAHHSLPDETVLTTVRPVSDLDQLYKEFTTYRFHMLKLRLEDQLRALGEAEGFDGAGVRKFLGEQRRFLAHMEGEMVPKELVTEGVVDDALLFGEGVGAGLSG